MPVPDPCLHFSKARVQVSSLRGINSCDKWTLKELNLTGHRENPYRFSSCFHIFGLKDQFSDRNETLGL